MLHLLSIYTRANMKSGRLVVSDRMDVEKLGHNPPLIPDSGAIINTVNLLLTRITSRGACALGLASAWLSPLPDRAFSFHNDSRQPARYRSGACAGTNKRILSPWIFAIRCRSSSPYPASIHHPAARRAIDAASASFLQSVCPNG